MYTREELEQENLTDFRVFLVHVWRHLGLPHPTPVQLDIAHQLQIAPEHHRRVIIQAFRGVGKSWITVAYVLWRLLLDPQLKIMVVSANDSLSGDFSNFCFQLIHGMPILQHLAPHGDQRKSTEKFDVGPATPSKDPSVKSVGITGQLSGSRADIIVSDDVEVPKNSYTHLLRERLAELVKEYDAVLKPGGVIVYLGTPQVEQSLYPRLESRGYRALIWPAEIPNRPQAYKNRLAPYILKVLEANKDPGTPIDPRRFNQDELDERRISYGSSGYALQFMLDTSPSLVEKHPLKCNDLLVADIDVKMGPTEIVWGRDKEQVIQDLLSGGFDGDVYVRPAWRAQEMARWQGTVLAIDPSGRGKDETAYAIVKYLHGNLYLVDSGGFRDGYGQDTLESIARAAVRWGVNYIVSEQNYGGGMFDKLLLPVIHRIALESKAEVLPKFDEEWKGWSNTQKELRILDTLEPVFKSHRLVIDRRVIERDLEVQADNQAYSLIYQMTRMERVKGCLAQDDRVDALAIAVAYWTERMSRDQKKAAQGHRDELRRQELKKFMRHAIGGRAPSLTHKWNPLPLDPAHANHPRSRPAIPYRSSS